MISPLTLEAAKLEHAARLRRAERAYWETDGLAVAPRHGRLARLAALARQLGYWRLSSAGHQAPEPTALLTIDPCP